MLPTVALGRACIFVLDFFKEPPLSGVQIFAEPDQTVNIRQ